MLNKFENHIATRFPFLKQGKLVVACSGGADSVVLAHLCHQVNLSISLAHCNFKLRGKESDADESFVRELGKNLGVQVLVKTFDTLGHKEEFGGSIQMAAREIRYQWFSHLLAEEGYDYLLTAHHMDDNLETFLVNLSRGTGIEGLTGIPETNKKIVRPFLDFSKDDIAAYAKSQNLQWREDSSNADNKYLRNKIRMELVPKLKELHPSFLSNFSETQGFLRQTQALAENHIEDIKKRLFRYEDNAYHIPLEELRQLEPIEAYLYGLFHSYGFREWQNVRNLLEAMSGKAVFSKTHRLLRDRTHLILSPLEPIDHNIYFIQEEESGVEEPIHLQLEIVSKMDKTSPNIVYLDKEKLNFPLVLRNWLKADYFYPFGMKGKKKLSKFFKDEKIDVLSKERQWLLCSDDEIAWVIGRRPDERFKVEPSTQKILKVTYKV